MKKIKIFATGVFATLSCSLNVQAWENKCHEYRNSPVASPVCGGRLLPADRVRNYDSGSHILECTGNVDNYIRRPQKFDFSDWDRTRRSGAAKDAFEMRRKLPDIEWTGRVLFQTVETWKWQECSADANAYECGTHQEPRTVMVSEPDGKGGSRTVTKTEYVTVANTCYYDHDRWEIQHCSNEKMNYTAHFERDKSWNMNSLEKGFAEFIPNKYDLLPGEIENVQIFNNAKKSRTINPRAEIGDAWNKYSFDFKGDVGAACQLNRIYNVSVAIKTEGRNFGKQSPNAFRLPMDVDGRSLEAVAWNADDSGKGLVKKAKPRGILLDDTSSYLVKQMAQQSRKNADRELAKAEVGQMGNQDAMSESDLNEGGFFKNTKVRVQLYKINAYWWDRKVGWSVYSDDSASQRASMNWISDNQELALSDKWFIDLVEPTNNKINLFGEKGMNLIPDRVYGLRVSMYQKGVPFYQQDCDMAPRFACAWPLIGRRENAYFSKPLEIRFETNPNYDKRGFFKKYFMHLPSFEWATKQRTSGENKK